MTRLSSRLRSDDGATAVLFAVVLPVLLSMLGYGSEVVALTGADRELQRTADQAALTAAAQIPLGDLGAIGGLADSDAILDALTPDATSPLADACAVAGANAASSSLLAGFAAAVPACENGGVTVTPVTTGLDPAAEVLAVLDALDDTTAPVVTVGDGGIVSVLGTLADLGLPLEVLGLAPALTVSQMRATATADVSTPLRNFITDDATTPLAGGATAQRRFKNILLLPVVDLGCTPGSLPLTDDVLAVLEGVLGTQALADLLTDVGLVEIPDLPLIPEDPPPGPTDPPTDPDDPPTEPDDPPVLPAPPPPPPAPAPPPPPPPAPPGIPVPIDPVGKRTVQAAQLGSIIEVLEDPLDTLPLPLTPAQVIALLPDGSTLPLGPGGALDPSLAVSAATRAAADAVLLATGGLGTLTGGCRIDLNQVVTPLAVQRLDEVLAALASTLATIGPVLPGAAELAALIADVRVDLADLLDPGTDAPTASEILRSAASADEDILIVTIGSTQIPALDFMLLPARQVMSNAAEAGDLSVFDVGALLAYEKRLPERAGSLLSGATSARGLFRATLVE